MIDQNIITHLKGWPELDTAVNGQITPVPLPQGYDGSAPAITVDSGVSFQGDMTSPEGLTGWASTRIQVNIIHPSKYMALQVARLVRVALVGYRGNMGSVKVGSISPPQIQIQWDPSAKLFMVISDFPVTLVAYH